MLRSHGSGVSSQVVAAYSAVLSRRGGRRLGIHRRTRACAAAAAAWDRRAAPRAPTPGRRRAAAGSKSPARRIENTSTRVRRRTRGRPCRSITRPRMRPRARRSTRAARSATGSRVQGQCLRQSDSQRTRHGVERVQVERIRAVHLDHGVEHQAVHVRGVAQRVGERDLRSVRGPVQGHLLGAELLAKRVDVVGRVAARVEGPAWAQAAGRRRRPRLPASRRLERSSALQRSSPGAAAAALVVDHQVAVAIERVQHGRSDGDPEGIRRRLARPAGEREHRGPRGAAAAARAHPHHEQRDAAGHGPRAVERHGHATALEHPRRTAALQLELRLGRGRGDEQEQCGARMTDQRRLNAETLSCGGTCAPLDVHLAEEHPTKRVSECARWRIPGRPATRPRTRNFRSSSSLIRTTPSRAPGPSMRSGPSLSLSVLQCAREAHPRHVLIAVEAKGAPGDREVAAAQATAASDRTSKLAAPMFRSAST